MKLSKKPEISFFEFLDSTLNFQCSENKTRLIHQLFPKLFTPRDVLI